MANESTLSLPSIEDRIAILRDNIRQLTEQAAAVSGAGAEELIADRITAQQAELDQLVAERDAILARRAAAAPKPAPAPKKKPAKKKRVKKKAAKTKKKAAARKTAKKTKKAAKKKKTRKAAKKKRK